MLFFCKYNAGHNAEFYCIVTLCVFSDFKRINRMNKTGEATRTIYMCAYAQISQYMHFFFKYMFLI